MFKSLLLTLGISASSLWGKPPNFIVIYIDDIGWTQTSDVGAETVTLIRQTLLDRLNESWLENGTARLERLKAEAATDPNDKQKAFQVGISENHVRFMNEQLERCERLNKMHRERGTTDQN